MKTLKEEFEQVIKALDQESKEYKEIIKRLSDLYTNFDQIYSEFLENNKLLTKNSDSLTKSSEGINNSLLSFKNDVYETLKILLDNQSKQDSRVLERLKYIENDFLKLITDSLASIVSKAETIREENKKFYKDLDDTIRIKLDNHQLVIKGFIGSEIQKQTEDIDKNYKKVKVGMWVICVIIIFLYFVSILNDIFNI